MPDIDRALAATGYANPMPAGWYSHERGENVSCAELVAGSATLGDYHRFRRAPDGGELSWDGRPIGRCASEIAAREDSGRTGSIYLFIRTCGERPELAYQIVPLGGSPGPDFRLVRGVSPSALRRLRIGPEDHRLELEYWGPESPPRLWEIEQAEPGTDTWTPPRAIDPPAIRSGPLGALPENGEP